MRNFCFKLLDVGRVLDVSHDLERVLCLKIISVCKKGLTGHTTPTVRAICKFAVFQFRSLDLFCRFTLVMKALGIVLIKRLSQTYFGHVNKPSTEESASHRHYFGFPNYVLTHLLTTRLQYDFVSMKLKPQKRKKIGGHRTRFEDKA